MIQVTSQGIHIRIVQVKTQDKILS